MTTNDQYKHGGAGFLGDLARMGGDVAANLTAEQVAHSGAGMWHDYRRMNPDFDPDPEPENSNPVDANEAVFVIEDTPLIVGAGAG